MNNNKTNIKEEIVSRFTLIYWGIIGLGIIAFIVSFTYMFILSGYFEKKNNTVKDRTLKALRGNILDVNGRVLSTNINSYDIAIDPKTDYVKANYTQQEYFLIVDTLAEKLETLFKNKTKEEYSSAIKKAYLLDTIHYVGIHYDADYYQYKKLKTFPLFNLKWYQGGLIVTRFDERARFQDSLARRVIGFENNEGKYVGIERLMNAELSGIDGIYVAQTLAGNYWRTLSVVKEPQNGYDIVTTIDINLQKILNDILKKQLIRLKAKFGVAILMEVETGEIRAMVNLSRRSDSVYTEIENNAVSALYEPGSVMKLASFIIAFENDPDLSLDKIIDTRNGKWQITNDFAITDYNYRPDGTGGFGRIPLKKVFELSSNVGTSMIIHSLFENNPWNFVNKLVEFGFDKTLDLGLEDEPKPHFSKPDAQNFSTISLRQMSIGYEINVTPMHIITFYNAIANGGKMVKPKFVKEIQQNGLPVKKPLETVVLNPLICSNSTLDKCKILLEGVVQNGTASEYVSSDIVKIAGKSGTSQIYKKESGYNKTIHNTTFVGYFPADKPKYTCLVWISEPTFNKSGSMAAGPVVKEMAEKIYAFDYDLHEGDFLLNNKPNTNSLPFAAKSFAGFLKTALDFIDLPYNQTSANWVMAHNEPENIVLRPIHIEKNIMPDVRGMNARDAVYVLEYYKLKIKIQGYGHVVSQSIAPGQIINNADEITIRLSMN